MYDEADRLLTKVRDEAHRFANYYRKQQERLAFKKAQEGLQGLFVFFVLYFVGDSLNKDWCERKEDNGEDNQCKSFLYDFQASKAIARIDK